MALTLAELMAALRLGDEAAIADFDEAIHLGPDNADAYNYRVIASRALEQTE